ncbi:6409_t:CDS:2, partial [Acaulospora colombiana]
MDISSLYLVSLEVSFKQLRDQSTREASSRIDHGPKSSSTWGTSSLVIHPTSFSRRLLFDRQAENIKSRFGIESIPKQKMRKSYMPHLSSIYSSVSRRWREKKHLRGSKRAALTVYPRIMFPLNHYSSKIIKRGISLPAPAETCSGEDVFAIRIAWDDAHGIAALLFESDQQPGIGHLNVTNQVTDGFWIIFKPNKLRSTKKVIDAANSARVLLFACDPEPFVPIGICLGGLRSLTGAHKSPLAVQDTFAELNVDSLVDVVD